MPTLGEYIREQRLGRGLSLGQLASKLGQTAAVVRSWERDHDLPDPTALGSLAEVLDVEVSSLTVLTPAPMKSSPPAPEPQGAAAPPPGPVVPPPVRDEPLLDDLDEGDSGEGAEEAADDAGLEQAPDPVEEAAVVEPVDDEALEEAPEPADDAAVIEEVEPVTTGATIQRGAPPEEAESGLDEESAETTGQVATSTSGGEPSLDLETEPVAMAEVMAEARRRAEEDGLPGGDEATGDELDVAEAGRQRRSFLEYWRDPQQRLRYYLRWLGTAIAMVVLAVVLVWAMGELLDALGRVTDQFGTQEPDDLESLARIITTRT